MTKGLLRAAVYYVAVVAHVICAALEDHIEID